MPRWSPRNGQIQTALTSGEVDIAAIATNVAANLAAQSDGSIRCWR